MEANYVDQPATRFLPFAELDEQALLDPRDPTDAAEQALAARAALTNQRRLVQAHPLWWVPLVAATLVAGQILPWWVGVPIAVAAVLALLLLYRSARGHARRTRAADDAIGIPVPPEFVEPLMYCSMELKLVVTWIKDATTDAAFDREVGRRGPHATVSRAIRRELDRLDQGYLEALQRTRMAWVAGEADRWRRAVADAAGYRPAISALRERMLADQRLLEIPRWNDDLL